MNDRIGWLHHKDGDSLSALGEDGFGWEPDDPEIDAPAPAAVLDVPMIDVDPESVIDRQVGQRAIEQ